MLFELFVLMDIAVVDSGLKGFDGEINACLNTCAVDFGVVHALPHGL